MKKKNDIKKLALLGMAAGMLLSADKADASFGNNEDNLDISSYLAAKCGSKCSSVAAGCGGKSGCNQVADRSTNANYYYQSCNSYPQYNNHGCSSNNPQGYSNHGCSSNYPQAYNNHGCSSGGAPQGYYDPSLSAANQGQNTTNANQPKGQNNNPSTSKYAGNNQGQQQGGNKQGQQQGGNQGQGSKYQAHGCGGTHGCNGGSAQGPHDGGQFQANSCSSQRPSSYNQGGTGYYNPNQVAEADKPATTTKLNEADLLSNLNAQGKSAYNSLSPEGKKLALQLANAECKGKNDCKGLNSCKTDKNTCAGKGGCKGQSTCSFKDKNLAVKVAAAKMAEKRNGLK